MSKKDRRLILQVISFLFFPVGIYLYFTAKPRQDAQLYGIIALVGFFFVGFGTYTWFC